MPRPLSETARQKAIDAAQTLLAEGGLENFTMDGVAKRSGVAKSTLYRHWMSSNELLVHAIDSTVEHVPACDTGTLRGDLKAMISELRALLEKPGNRELILEVLGIAARDPEFAAVKESMMSERMRPIRQIIEQAIDREEIPAMDLDMACLLVEGPFHSRFLMSGEPVSEGDVETLVNFVARGLGSPDR